MPLFFDIATQSFGGFGSENDSFLGHGTREARTLKATKITVTIYHRQRCSATNRRSKRCFLTEPDTGCRYQGTIAEGALSGVAKVVEIEFSKLISHAIDKGS